MNANAALLIVDALRKWEGDRDSDCNPLVVWAAAMAGMSHEEVRAFLAGWERCEWVPRDDNLPTSTLDHLDTLYQEGSKLREVFPYRRPPLRQAKYPF